MTVVLDLRAIHEVLPNNGVQPTRFARSAYG